ncbi:MAG: hypothetical protein WBX29_04575, partial [Nitrososphaeraceae archaeon]
DVSKPVWERTAMPRAIRIAPTIYFAFIILYFFLGVSQKGLLIPIFYICLIVIVIWYCLIKLPLDGNSP